MCGDVCVHVYGFVVDTSTHTLEVIEIAWPGWKIWCIHLRFIHQVRAQTLHNERQKMNHAHGINDITNFPISCSFIISRSTSRVGRDASSKSITLPLTAPIRRLTRCQKIRARHERRTETDGERIGERMMMIMVMMMQMMLSAGGDRHEYVLLFASSGFNLTRGARKHSLESFVADADIAFLGTSILRSLALSPSVTRFTGSAGTRTHTHQKTAPEIERQLEWSFSFFCWQSSVALAKGVQRVASFGGQSDGITNNLQCTNNLNYLVIYV